MQEFKDLADKLKTGFKINYNADGIKFLEGFIERNKAQITKDEWEGLINSCGAFVGQCIIENYGGQWVRDESGQAAILFNENNKIYPFTKVRKQFENGLEDSIYAIYTIIPAVFKAGIKTRKKWWQFRLFFRSNKLNP